jgi:hypothetical protein
VSGAHLWRPALSIGSVGESPAQSLHPDSEGAAEAAAEAIRDLAATAAGSSRPEAL